MSLDQLDNPTILPSGFTINESYFDKLINRRDPYNKNLTVKCKIVNRFAKEVKEIIEGFKKLVAEDEQKIQNEINEKESQDLFIFSKEQTDYLLETDSSNQIEKSIKLAENSKYDQ